MVLFFILKCCMTMNFSYKVGLIFVLLFANFPLLFANLESISIITDGKKHLENPIAKQAIEDCLNLLRAACDCDVRLDNPQAQIILQLPEILDNEEKIRSRFVQNVDFPYLEYPNHDYSWYSQRIGEQLLMQLQTPSYEGLAAGLYGLLQEQLWFAFYHPKQTYVPKLRYWPLTESFYWHAKARFDKKGFHLHTMHPIELTEPLLNVNCENGKVEIKKYIDWLARNQQNYMEFCVLNSIDTAKWGDYMKEIVDYGHSRGVIMGIDISLNMSQQKAFCLYKGKFISKKEKKRQIENNLKLLCRSGWDVINMEMSGTEFTSGNVSEREELRFFVQNIVENKYKAKLVGRQHVVKAENIRAGKNNKILHSTNANKNTNDKARGLLVHTVMFYNLFDKEAPVYENQNFSHLLNSLSENQYQRETWYYPESAYWVTFDNSVPMFLTPYLNARLEDIEQLDTMNVKGHVTFSSGWEWSYWLIDWSIARWCWKHEINGVQEMNTASQYIGDLFRRENTVNVFAKMMKLQHDFLKEKQLIRYMCPSSVTDEMPKMFGLNMEFQPRPKHSYKWWRYKSPYDSIMVFKRKIEQLDSFYKQNERILSELIAEERVIVDKNPELSPIINEFILSFKIIGLRAKHRARMLTYLLNKRLHKLGKKELKDNILQLAEAITTREEAQRLVKEREKQYRYPAEWISASGANSTAYNFGYLHLVADLQLWQREEEQYINDNYSPFYFSKWNVAKVMGWEK
jgi:hypothetical protein